VGFAAHGLLDCGTPDAFNQALLRQCEPPLRPWMSATAPRADAPANHRRFADTVGV